MSLKSYDIVVGLKSHLWVDTDAWTFEKLGFSLGLSTSQAHTALRRLADASLFRPSDRSLRIQAFTAFAEHGIPHVFPAQPGIESIGTPTAHAASPLAEMLVYAEAYVWPSTTGIPGRAIVPLHRTVPAAVAADPRLHAALALIDALRVGRVRERKIAAVELEKLLSSAAHDEAWRHEYRHANEVA